MWRQGPVLWLLAGTLAGCAGPPEAFRQPAGPDEPGRRLTLARCAKCHRLYDPAKYAEPEWRDWMNRMSVKAKLDDEQQELVSRYLESLRQRRRR
jgi:hypothetical protein